ncbi:hypothetical protein WMY93_002893 [Mugilogobius chulae]|uniref:Uncharacterized protein n=1 Tax=Mugilogobius chulae TaxID=88201 RepID=A0AAW0Q5S2_9GOBI
MTNAEETQAPSYAAPSSSENKEEIEGLPALQTQVVTRSQKKAGSAQHVANHTARQMLRENTVRQPGSIMGVGEVGSAAVAIGCLRHRSSPSRAPINALPPATVAVNHRPQWRDKPFRSCSTL